MRFFGGWDYVSDDASVPNLAEVGYEKGVPMGGDLTRAPVDKAPRFLIQAAKDPKNANLDRIQVIKGWYKQGQRFERIYEVAWAGERKLGVDGKLPPVGNTVDLKTATYTNDIGVPQLATVWTDPDFDPAARAFYYVRVLQIPTPRHTLYDAVALQVPHPENKPATIQERAYTSPIWYTPTEEVLADADAKAMTLSKLKQQGAEQLDATALKALVVGKTLAVRNLVTGELLEARFGEDGHRVLRNITDEQIQAEAWEVMHGGAGLGGVAPYEIGDGRIVTRFDNKKFEVRVFRVDGRHLAVRSNEQGYANYEVLASD